MSKKSSESDQAQNAAQKIEVIRHGLDEMNLTEYPFASLWKNTELRTEILNEWETVHPRTGKVVKAFWRVTGDPKLGLPTARDEQLYLVLMELTREAGMQSPTVHCSRYDLIKRLGWSFCERDYDVLRDGLTRLKAVTITSQNAFWDAKKRTFRITGEGLLDSFNMESEDGGRKSARAGSAPDSYFCWSSLMFKSFQAGYLKTVDLDLAQSLSSPLALRLYRYLDKKAFGTRRHFEIGLAVLCERHLGMRTSPYPSKHKERLRTAHEELIACGFLQNAEYESMKTKCGEKVRYTFGPRKGQVLEAPAQEMAPGTASASDLAISEAEAQSTTDQPTLLELPLDAEPTVALTAAQEELLEQMLRLKISLAVAQDFLHSTAPDELRAQLDCLEDREPRDAAATFVRAVREQWELPGKYLQRQEAQERAKKAQTTQESGQALKAAQRAATAQQRASQKVEEEKLDVLWEHMALAERQKLDAEARARLGVLGQTGRASGALRAMRRNLMREQGLVAAPDESD